MSECMIFQGETPAGKPQQAIGSWIATVGTIIMARFVDDPQFEQEILIQTKGWITGAATRHREFEARTIVQPPQPPLIYGCTSAV